MYPRPGPLRWHLLVVATGLGAGCAFDASGVGGDDTTHADPSATTSGSATATDADPTTNATVTTTVDPTGDGTTTVDPTVATDPSDPTTTSSSTDGSSSESGGVRGWWDPAWASRRRIDLRLPDRVAGPLDGVPLYLLLDDTRIDYGELRPRGQDLRFVDADDDTVLAHEIETWNPDGGSVVWVKIPQLEGQDDFIYMYWGNPAAENGASPATLWTPGYAGVWHLAQDPAGDAPQFDDSSPALRDATAQGGMAADDLVDGFISRAIDFDGVDDTALVGHIDTDAWTELTVSAWVFHRDNGDDRAVSKAFGTGGSDHVFMLGGHGSDIKVRVRTDGDGAGTTEVRPTGSLPVNEWHHVAMTWSAASAEIALFIDGDPAATSARDGDTLADTNADVFIANVAPSDARYWNGVIDEVRIEHDARSPDWIRTQYDGMRGTLATFADEETVP